MSEHRQEDSTTRQEDYPGYVEELYTRFGTDVLRVSYFYLGERQGAEDVMQEVFVRLFTRQPELKEGSEKSWLLKVALNICRDRWRSAWARRVILGSKQLEILPAHDDIEQREEKEALMQAVHALPPDIRETFLLFYYQGLTIDEIAELTGSPSGTIASRLSRGRKKLKHLLTEEDLP